MHGRTSSSRPITPRLLVEAVDVVDSTNSELLRREPLLPSGSPAEAIWLVANRQTAGRGRRERSWVSTADGSLTGSFACEAERPLHLGGLSLVAGLAVAQALDAFGVRVRLKWPNDLHVDAGKAGGILCEARARGDVSRLVIGCGLNLLAPQAQVGQPAAGLFATAAMPDRSELVLAIGMALLGAIDRLLAEGFAPFRQAWSDRDLLLGRPILIHDYEGSSAAVARGIDGDGALLVEPEGKPGVIRRVLAEEVSVRPLS
jgi:BirA family transcriptional regulator, biotin operon repressor / biotin---[acetyl-CoA-carboxylase] ligase